MGVPVLQPTNAQVNGCGPQPLTLSAPDFSSAQGSWLWPQVGKVCPSLSVTPSNNSQTFKQTEQMWMGPREPRLHRASQAAVTGPGRQRAPRFHLLVPCLVTTLISATTQTDPEP